MKRFISIATVLSVVGLLLTTGAFAQTGTTPSTSPSMSPSMAGTDMLASRLIGADIKNQQGEDIGEIEELVIDPKEAKIKQVVVSTGGVLGLGAKSVAIPWSQVRPAAEGGGFVVAMSQEELKNAPSWERPAGMGRTGTREGTRAPASPSTSDRPGTTGR